MDLSLFVIKDAHSPLCTRKHVLLDSASEPINILFLSAKFSFLDSWIMFTDNTSFTHFFTESCFDSHGLVPTYLSHFILYYLPPLCSHIVRSNRVGWICQSCSCFSTFGFAIFLPKMFYSQFFSHLRHSSLKYCLMQLKYHPLCPAFYCHSQFVHTHALSLFKWYLLFLAYYLLSTSPAPSHLPSQGEGKFHEVTDLTCLIPCCALYCPVYKMVSHTCTVMAEYLWTNA